MYFCKTFDTNFIHAHGHYVTDLTEVALAEMSGITLYDRQARARNISAPRLYQKIYRSFKSLIIHFSLLVACKCVDSICFMTAVAFFAALYIGVS